MLKKYNDFLNESNIPGPKLDGSVSIDLKDDESELFSSEDELKSLISNQKVSLLSPKLWYNSNDVETINVLKNYFDMENESVKTNEAKLFPKKKNDIRNIEELQAEKKLMMRDLTKIGKEIIKMEKEKDELIELIHEIEDRIVENKKKK